LLDEIWRLRWWSDQMPQKKQKGVLFADWRKHCGKFLDQEVTQVVEKRLG
jgi:hypothetical protein